jgi:hypothetical protein
MKKLLLIFTFIGLTSFANAQTSVYHPMPDSNAVWCENYSYTDGYGYCDMTYAQFINGDSTIGGITYHKLYRTGYAIATGGGGNYYNQFTGLFRQDISNKKVYTYQYNADTLLYDFNLSLHDTLSPTVLNNQIINYVCYIDSILVDNNYRKRFWLSTNGDSAYVALIEGEGSTFGLMIAKLFPPFEAVGTLNGFSDTVHNNHATAFCDINIGIQEIVQIALLKIYPNPATDILTIEAPCLAGRQAQRATIEILNIQGQTILQKELRQGKTDIDINELAKGIYILRLNSNDKTSVKKIVKE